MSDSPVIETWRGEEDQAHVVQVDAPDGIHVRININDSTLMDQVIGAGESFINRAALAFYQAEMSTSPHWRHFDHAEMVQYRTELLHLGYGHVEVDSCGLITDEPEDED